MNKTVQALLTTSLPGRAPTLEEIRQDDIIAELYKVVWKPAIDQARREGKPDIDFELFNRRTPEEVQFYDAAVRFAKRSRLSFYVVKIPATEHAHMHFVLRVTP